jgi:hypothetical protein
MPAEHQMDSVTAVDLLRACHSRRLDREGIPMVIALQDEREAMPAITDRRMRADGEQFAELLDEYADLLTPSTAFRPGDEGALITVLQVLAYAHFEVSEPSKPQPGAQPERGASA